MKKILSLILCVCLLVPFFTFLAYAEGDGDSDPSPVNIASEATVTVSSLYNAYKPASAINDGKITESGSTTWSPNTAQRDPTLAGVNPWFTLSFASSFKVSEISVIMTLPYSNKCNLKIEAFVGDAWVELGACKYENSSAFSGSDTLKDVKVTLSETVETAQIRVTFSGYTEWDPPCVSECIVMAIPGSEPVTPPNPPIDTTDHRNIVTEAIPSVFTNYNLDSKPTYLNDGIIKGQINSYMQWRPQTVGRDPSVAGTNPWIKFKFKDYMLISEITVLVDHGYSSENIVKYEALVQGEWIELGTSRYSTSGPYEGFENEAGVRAVTLKIPQGVTTKQIRMSFSGYIDWDPPMICECVVKGIEGEAPEFDVPEGAWLTTNVALGGFGEASSSAINRYPALANDDNPITYWVSKNTSDGQWYKIDFDKPYSIGTVNLNLSAIKLIEDEANEITEAYTYNIKVELLVNNVWTTVYSGDVTTSEGADAVYAKALDNPLTATSIKVTYVKTNGNPAVLSEISAVTSDGSKCIYIGDIITQEQKLSTAGGNLGCFGTPYASSVFTFSNISDVSYINDGLIEKDSYIWIPETPACPAYCGIVLDKKAKVDTVVLYFNDEYGKFTDGDWYVCSFDVQCKNASGQYVTVASGTSVDKTTGKAIVTLSFAPVETDDVRIVFTTNGGRSPYLKELEIYSHSTEDVLYILSQYVSLPTTRGLPAITKEFCDYTTVKRPDIMRKRPLVPMYSAPVVREPSTESTEDNTEE